MYEALWEKVLPFQVGETASIDTEHIKLSTSVSFYAVCFIVVWSLPAIDIYTVGSIATIIRIYFFSGSIFNCTVNILLHFLNIFFHFSRFHTVLYTRGRFNSFQLIPFFF